MPRKAREVITGLGKKGFRKRENDHTYLTLWVDGRKTAVWTKVSHGEKEIHDRLLAVMARQICLSRQQFLDLVDCPLTEVEYIQMLREGGHVA